MQRHLILFALIVCAKSIGSAQTLTATNLPIISLETNGLPIDFQRIDAQFSVVDNPAGQVNHPDDPPAYEGPISIRLRGNYSAGLPQKPYALETHDSATGLDTSVALLGMPKEEDWIMLANWNDKSLVRNPLMFELARRMGHWAPHTRHVEVLLNGNYEGIYTFCEKIKRDSKRVNVKKLTPDDNTLPEVSGGYIFKHDYGWDFGTDNWHPQNCPDRWLNFELEYPDAASITPAQFDYLTNYLDDAEEALFSPNFSDPATGYRQFLDVDAWVDYFLLSELSGNVDAYKKSMYYSKDRDSLLKVGPIWDFDWALKFLGENGFPNGAGWLYAVDPCTQDVLYVPYFKRLLEDSFFQQRACERWTALRASVLDTAQVFAYIDSTANVLDAAKERHFQRWQCLGYNSGADEVPPYPATYAGEVAKLKKFLRLRFAWMDTNLPKVTCLTNVEEPDNRFELTVKPNISDGVFRIETKGLNAPTEAKVFDSSGKLCQKITISNGETILNLQTAPIGVYFISLRVGDKNLLRRIAVAK